MLRTTNIRRHVAMMLTRSIPTKAVLANTGISQRRLNDPGYLVDIEQCNAVVANMLRLTGDPGLGLEIGSQTVITDLGIIGYAMASATTLGQAVGLWMQYGHSPIGFPFTPKLFHDEATGRWGAVAHARGFSGDIFRFYVEEICAIGFALGPQLLGRRLVPLEMTFSYPKPAHHARYEEVFGRRAQFGAPKTCAVIKSPRYDTALKGSDSDLRELCLQHCRDLVRQTGHSESIAERLRSHMRASGAVPSLAEAAAHLGVSTRTLRRQLQSEDTCFRDVVDCFRRVLASEYLGPGMIPAKEVSYLLGFSNPNAFRSAFKSWTGQTTGEYQKSFRTQTLQSRQD